MDKYSQEELIEKLSEVENELGVILHQLANLKTITQSETEIIWSALRTVIIARRKWQDGQRVVAIRKINASPKGTEGTIRFDRQAVAWIDFDDGHSVCLPFESAFRTI